jgi:hypothetical protein
MPYDGVRKASGMGLFIHLVAGALIGGAFGVLLGRSKICSPTGCNLRANMIFSIIAGAVLGTSVAWWLTTR